MTSRKRASWSKQKADFNASLGDVDYLYSRGQGPGGGSSRNHQDDFQVKSCKSKKRYASKAEAELVIQDCADYGRTGLSCYHCEFCDGWHLTSKHYR